MKALRYHGPGEGIELDEVEKPQPQVGEVLVHVAASSLCPLDLHIADNGEHWEGRPVTVGHEAVGTIEAVGQGVDSSRTGDRVIVYYYSGCNDCRFCRRGDENLCSDVHTQYGLEHDGAHAEYMTVPERNAVPISDEISDLQAVPIACGLTSAVHAVHQGNLRYGDMAIIYGVNHIGYNLIQLANDHGARVIAVGSGQVKLEKARELGADQVINAADGSVARRVKEVDLGEGVDVLFECTGQEEVMRESVEVLGRRGRMVLIGQRDDRLTVDPLALIRSEQQIVGSVGGGVQDLYEAVNLVEQGKVRTIVDRSLPLEEYEEGVRALERGELVGKAVLVPA